jgi:hypothetical protein
MSSVETNLNMRGTIIMILFTSLHSPMTIDSNKFGHPYEGNYVNPLNKLSIFLPSLYEKNQPIHVATV